MAEVDQQDTEAGAGNARKKLKSILMIAFGAILIATLSMAGTWFMLRGTDNAASGNELDAPGGMAGNGSLVPDGPAMYLALQPPFVVNYTDGARTRFLQLELSLMARDDATLDIATAHMPLIRNNLLDVLARQDFKALQTLEGKQQLVVELTESVQAVMQEKLGRPGIETVLFRSFVMQ